MAKKCTVTACRSVAP